SIFVITSLFACSLAFHNGISRYLYTLGRDGVLPARLGITGANGAPRTASVVQSISVVAIMTPFVIAGADPIGTLFFWGSGIAVVGILALYFGASISIVAFFRKNRDAEMTVWQQLIAPALSIVVLGGALVLILSNFELLTGGTREFALGLASTVLIALLVGVVLYSVRARKLSPDAMKDLAAEVS
ncbi:MAG: Putrescine importer PuuP, partial [Actinomycetota bacterium]